jgi:alanine dehydrogenase
LEIAAGGGTTGDDTAGFFSDCDNTDFDENGADIVDKVDAVDDGVVCGTQVV